MLLFVACLFGCSKELELKPDSTIIVPETIQDFEQLLDNAEVLNTTPGLAQLSADEYFIPSLQAWNSLSNLTQRNAYIWNKDIFQGESKIWDWAAPYAGIFYCNSVLDILELQDIGNNPAKKNIRGWALFARAYSYYSLVSIFAKTYDPATANSDLGLPLKLSSDIKKIVQRSTLQETYDSIISDVLTAADLLKAEVTTDKRNRPSKVAAYALLARVYLSMRIYDQAEIYADKALLLCPELLDYNTLTVLPGRSSFTYNSPETIYFTQQAAKYIETTFSSSVSYGVDSSLIALYGADDLRMPIYFRKNAIGNYGLRPINNVAPNPFTGLATDELYLIKAECLARRKQKEEALLYLNKLLEKRVKTGAFTPVMALDAEDALQIILTERRKSLVWRSVRWTDLKRLNLEGRNIKLERNMGGHIYELQPNSPLYVLPIPNDEVTLSGITQNDR